MQRVLHILATRRAAIAVIAAVILTLAGFAVWATRTTYQSVNNVQRLTTVNDAFQDARHAIAQENLAARRYQVRNYPVHIREYDQARAELDRSLTTVRALGSSHDLRVAATIEDQNQRASVWFAKLPTYIQHNDINHVDAVSGRLQPLFNSMAATLNSSGRQHSAAALASLAQSRRSERVVVAITVITVAFGILLLTAASAAMRYRERLERIRQRELERLKRAALTDSLSGLGNHRAFEEDLQRDLDHAAETGTELSLALLDLDGLKQTNDAHGHQVGDECIRSVGAALREAGAGTSAYRIGGDEFALIVHERRAVDTLYLVQHLQTHMTAASETRPVSASSGVAESCPTLGRDGLIRRADLALIQAKRSHRRCLLYNEALEPTLSTPDQAAEQRHTDALATALARAVDAKDAYTHSHCETVSELCGLIAQELGMDARQIGRLRLAGLLHDVGKIGITDTILQKPGPLTDDEFAIMKTHTRLGHAIVVGCGAPDRGGVDPAPPRARGRRRLPRRPGRANRSRWSRGSSWSPTPSRRSPPTVPTACTARPTRRWSSWSDNAGTQFDPDCVAALGRVVRPQLRQVA